MMASLNRTMAAASRGVRPAVCTPRMRSTRQMSQSSMLRKPALEHVEAVDASVSPIPTSTAPSQWSSLSQPRLARESFLDLLHGRIPAICEPQFLSAEACTNYQNYLNPKLAPYDHIAGPRVDKVGVAQFEFQAQSAEDFKNRKADAKSDYFAKAEQLRGLHAQIAQATSAPDPAARILQQLAALFPDMDVTLAREADGRRYHSGIYRAINDSTPIHCDWSPYDSATEDWIINRVTAQCVYNLYLAPMRGGQTVLYERQWTARVLADRDPDTYGYFPRAVAGCRTATIAPSPGDLVFFNTRNLHEVKAVQDEEHAVLGRWKRPRLTMSSFIGALPAGVISDRPALILWS